MILEKRHMKDFAAIDFETANKYSCSICSIGLIIVKEGEIINRYYKLLHPVPNYYSLRHIAIHGIKPEDTEAEDTFPEVWAEVEQLIEGLPLIAHFSRFDESCLKAAFRRFGMKYPNYQFYCSCTLSRKKIGDILPNHKLPTVARFCGYNLANHHHALADAEACAHIWYYLTEGEKLIEI